MQSMIASVFVFCALLAPAYAADGLPVTVSLPSTAPYTYWVRGSGALIQLPITKTGHKTITVANAEAGNTLYVLDSQSGKLAARVLQRSANGKFNPIVLATSDFTEALAAATQSIAPATAAAPATPSDKPEVDRSSPWRVIGLIFSLICAGAVVWLISKIVRGNGQPLIDVARRAGIYVPDPSAPEPDPAPFVPQQVAQQRPVEAIPEAAGAQPAVRSQAPAHGPLAIPQLVGIQGLAGGTVFSLADSVVTIGRDGTNSIVLAENAVSRQHARLERDHDGRINICDLGSSNGVIVNGMRTGESILNDGDEVKIGDSLFRFEQ